MFKRRLRPSKRRSARPGRPESSIDSSPQGSLQSATSPAAVRSILQKSDTSHGSRNSTVESVRRVRFQSVIVRQYERTLGDNPSCSSGAPITIGWGHSDEAPVAIDEYEQSKPKFRRGTSELILSRQDREEMLLEWGASFHDIIDAIRTNVRVKNQRRRTVSSIGTYDRWEEVMEKAGRKIKRTLKLQKQPSNPNPQYPKPPLPPVPTSLPSEGFQTPRPSSDTPPSHPQQDPDHRGMTLPKLPMPETKEVSIVSDDLENLYAHQQEKDPLQTHQHQSEERSLSPREELPVSVVDMHSDFEPSEFGATTIASDGYDDYRDVFEEQPAVEPPSYRDRQRKPKLPKFEELGASDAYWEVTEGVDGPVIRKKTIPVVIYEDSLNEEDHHQHHEWQQQAGMRMQAPPRSDAMSSQWH